MRIEDLATTEILERLHDVVGELFAARVANLQRADTTPILCGLRTRALSMKIVTTLQAGEPVGVSCYAVEDGGIEELLFELEGGPPLWAAPPSPRGLVSEKLGSAKYDAIALLMIAGTQPCPSTRSRSSQFGSTISWRRS